jgi:hypothetical protein
MAIHKKPIDATPSKLLTQFAEEIAVNSRGIILDVPCGDGEIRSCLYVEKGLGRESQAPKTQIMDSMWFWHTFLDEMETDRFSSAMNSIQSEAGTPPSRIECPSVLNHLRQIGESHE